MPGSTNQDNNLNGGRRFIKSSQQSQFLDQRLLACLMVLNTKRLLQTEFPRYSKSTFWLMTFLNFATWLCYQGQTSVWLLVREDQIVCLCKWQHEFHFGNQMRPLILCRIKILWWHSMQTLSQSITSTYTHWIHERKNCGIVASIRQLYNEPNLFWSIKLKT